MKWKPVIFIALCLAVACGARGVQAQSATECPPDKVCISREAALKALADADRVKALEAEMKVKDAAIDSFKDELNKMRIEFARVSGEATGLRTQAARDAAVIELLLKYARPKKFGLLVF